jgi:transposase
MVHCSHWPPCVCRSAATAIGRCAGFAHRWPTAGWAIEGAAGLGAPLSTLLGTDGIEVIDVPAKLAARVRVLSSGHGRKNDDADALSVGLAALTSPALGTVEIDAATTALRAVVEHRDDLVKTRTQTVNRLHVVLTRLVPAGARRHLSADHAAELVRGVRPRDAAAQTLRALAMDLVSEVRPLDRRIAKAANDIQMAVSASGATLTELHGLGALTAGKILGHVGDVSRFRSAAAFAGYAAPPPSRCPPARWCATGCPAPAIANSISASTSWPSPKSATIPPPGPTTCGNDPKAKITTKPCAA